MLLLLINLICNMLGNMLNDLAEAIRRWTEKKSNATATVRTCPSPCPAKESRLSRIYSSCGPGRTTPMGVNRRQSTRTNASVSFVLRSIIILLTGILGWRMPIVNGSRAGLACAKTSNSHRLRVSPRNAISSINTEKLAWKTK